MEKQKELKPTAKIIFASALLKKCFEKSGTAQVPKVMFEQNEKECKENDIKTPQALTSTCALFKRYGLATPQKITYNEKIVTAYTPL